MRAISFMGIVAVTAAISGCASDGYGYRGDRYAGGCERDRANNRVAGTVVGAGVGTLAGSAIAGNSSNTAGAVAGGVAGAVIGNQVAKGDPCPSDYPRRHRHR